MFSRVPHWFKGIFLVLLILPSIALPAATLRPSAVFADQEGKVENNTQTKGGDKNQGERVHVRHILFKTVDKSDEEKKAALQKAERVFAQLKKGSDFAKLAKENSDDKTTKDKGGDLGWIFRGQTYPEFEKAVFNLKPKQLELVTTSLGYHIIEVMEHQQATKPAAH